MNTCLRVEDGKVRLFKRGGNFFLRIFRADVEGGVKEKRSVCGEEEEGSKRTSGEKSLPLERRGSDY